jgi:hypothetical protein
VEVEAPGIDFLCTSPEAKRPSLRGRIAGRVQKKQMTGGMLFFLGKKTEVEAPGIEPRRVRRERRPGKTGKEGRGPLRTVLSAL